MHLLTAFVAHWSTAEPLDASVVVIAVVGLVIVIGHAIWTRVTFGQQEHWDDEGHTRPRW